MPAGCAVAVVVWQWLAVSSLGTTPFPPPKDYEKNPHVKYSAVRTPEGDLRVRFEFKDHEGMPLVYEHVYRYQHAIDMLWRYGLPESFFQGALVSERPNRRKIIENGLLKRNGDRIGVDLSAVTAFYAEDFAKPIADFLLENLKKRNIDDREHRISIAMAFTQDIPYGVPEFDDGTYDFFGVSPAPLILLSGYGDCDSKATLFAGILSYLIDPSDILFLHPTDRRHVLTAIRGEDAPGRWTLPFERETFVVAETAGPGRPEFGHKGQDARPTTYEIEKYKAGPVPFDSSANYKAYPEIASHLDRFLAYDVSWNAETSSEGVPARPALAKRDPVAKQGGGGAAPVVGSRNVEEQVDVVEERVVVVEKGEVVERRVKVIETRVTVVEWEGDVSEEREEVVTEWIEVVKPVGAVGGEKGKVPSRG
jgi:hypothetical protein